MSAIYVGQFYLLKRNYIGHLAISVYAHWGNGRREVHFAFSENTKVSLQCCSKGYIYLLGI